MIFLKRGNLSREIVLNQALSLASEKGLEKLTYNGLARSLSVQPQSLYRYVENIADVKSGVVAEYVQRLTTSLYKELVPYSGKDALRRFAIYFISSTQNSMPFADMISGLTTYGHTPQLVAEITKLRELSTTIIRSITTDESQIKANEQLFLNFIIGNLALVTVGAPNAVRDKDVFEQNIDRVLSLIN